MTQAAHQRKVAELAAALAAAGAPSRGTLGLRKRTSNLFRDRRAARPRIDLSGFDRVIALDAAAGCVDAEGMTRYDRLADATLAAGCMPQVVPQLRSITLGGALAGVGIEASSFRHGLVHETVESFELLTGDGRIVHCAAGGEHDALYRGFPNSYGTLGYALAVRARTMPVRPFVLLEHRRCDRLAACLEAIAAELRAPSVDFLEAVAFAPHDIVLTRARFADHAEAPGDYGFEQIYWHSLRARAHDALAVRDYLWRWDTDWFWCSRNLGAERPWVRRLLGRERLNSLTYQRVMRWNARWGLTRAWQRLRGRHPESVIQDVQIPLARAAEFLDFLAREIGIWPVWLCPIRPAPAAGPHWPLFALPAGVPFLNFGFWDVIAHRVRRPPGHYNRLVEAQVAALGGRKSLYSECRYT
ncbi:MAG: FAD-binding oxidoreductase, partial [Comamonadaceae bacterium]|nr:FAD-binding oxidoreductase [Comamonadaceae bacterium]